MKVEPYTALELERVLAFEMPQDPAPGKCDWCGGEYIGRPSGPHICSRCWNCRAQLRAAIRLSAVELPVVEREPDHAHNDASSDCSADKSVQGAFGMIGSFSSDNAESRFYNRPAPRTICKLDMSNFSVLDRHGEKKKGRSDCAPVVQGELVERVARSKSLQVERMSFPNSPQKTIGGNEHEK